MTDPLMHPSNHARVAPVRPAYVIAERDVVVTFDALDRRSNQIAHVFRGLGLEVGDGVALLCANEPGFFEICWAAQRSGLSSRPTG